MKITYRTSKDLSAGAILSLFRRNEWREWFTLRDTEDLLHYALYVASAWHGIVDRFLQVEMRHLSAGMHPRIRASRGFDPHMLLIGHLSQQTFELTLNRAVTRLNLPARIVRSIVGNLDFITRRHGRIISNHRDKSASLLRVF